MVSEAFNISTLRALDLFAPLTVEQLEHLRPAVSVRIATVGEVIMQEGEPGNELWILLVGECKVVGGFRTPEEHIIDTMQPVEIIGEMALLTHKPRAATVIVTEPSRFLTVTAEGLDEVLMEHPGVTLALLKQAYKNLEDLRARLSKATRGPVS